MEIKDAVLAALKELIIPELNSIKNENKEIKARLDLTNKRLDDINIHLADHSRRIDETNKRIDAVREDLTNRIDAVRVDLTNRMDAMRVDFNKRIDRLYEVIVRRDEHAGLEQRMIALEQFAGRVSSKLGLDAVSLGQ